MSKPQDSQVWSSTARASTEFRAEFAIAVPSGTVRSGAERDVPLVQLSISEPASARIGLGPLLIPQIPYCYGPYRSRL